MVDHAQLLQLKACRQFTTLFVRIKSTGVATGGARRPWPQISSISCRFVHWETVSQRKYCCSLKIKIFGLPKIFGWLRYWLRAQFNQSNNPLIFMWPPSASGLFTSHGCQFGFFQTTSWNSGVFNKLGNFENNWHFLKKIKKAGNNLAFSVGKAWLWQNIVWAANTLQISYVESLCPCRVQRKLQRFYFCPKNARCIW